MFTKENTKGYTSEELEKLNEELARKLEGIEDDDTREEITQNFSDEVSHRY